MNIGKKLAAWQKADLITARQMQDIQNYEKENSQPYLFYGMLALSLFCVGLGIIAVIAANWDHIPPAIKFGMDFLLLFLCGAGAYSAYQRGKMPWFNALIFLFALLILASIGLIAQVYQLQPDGTAAYLLWAALVFPLLFFVRSALLPLIWLPVAWFSFWGYIIDHNIAAQLLETLVKSWVYAVPLLWLFSWGIFYQILNVFISPKAEGLRKALMFWLVFFMGFLIYVMDKDYSYHLFYHLNGDGLLPDSQAFAVSVVLSAGLAVLSGYLSYLDHKKFLMPYIMALMVIGGLFHLHFVLSLLALLGAGFYAYRSGSRRLLNFVLVLTAIRIFVIYLDVFGSLMSTGLGLIVSGVVLLGIIYGWLKSAAYFKRRAENEK